MGVPTATMQTFAEVSDCKRERHNSLDIRLLDDLVDDGEHAWRIARLIVLAALR